MTIENLTTGSLHLLHGAHTRAMWADDTNPSPVKEYGVRTYRDWRLQADRIEAELHRRGEAFAPLPW